MAHNDKLGVTSCTIITAPAVDHIGHIHTRMPVTLHPAAYEAWLDASAQGADAKAFLIRSTESFGFTVSGVR
ncbi:MAG: SOS response-associated peptidase [Alphaproteobacteria bacterium]|nr:SOS response-associated peptidase [Alphaproteobacteria bacterium]MBU1552076.1 SOS response-associated peptidase [Alphaproteobacteria bacterium]MBU2337686.1 SOS response-associated peptidase [Alphaproteobacteria bacterium]MBU2391526.1 SOS response-associated peptidase [Alphaproteobacteria bacterium]